MEGLLSGYGAVALSGDPDPKADCVVQGTYQSLQKKYAWLTGPRQIRPIKLLLQALVAALHYTVSFGVISCHVWRLFIQQSVALLWFAEQSVAEPLAVI